VGLRKLVPPYIQQLIGPDRRSRRYFPVTPHLETGRRSAHRKERDREATPEAELDAPAPEPMRRRMPSVGVVLMMLGSHWLVHAGQFVPIRRKLGKPPLF
jgi:hypothetical protein